MVASMSDQPHVLVVDDDAKIAAALRRALIYEGYQVEVAPDGQIALTRARERMPDLAILDIMMPGIDGLEVTRRLRAEGDVPILLLTAKDGLPTASRAWTAAPMTTWSSPLPTRNCSPGCGRCFAGARRGRVERFAMPTS